MSRLGKTLPPERKQGQSSGENTPFLSVDWGESILDTGCEAPDVKTVTELRTEFIEHSLRRASELVANDCHSEDLQYALDIYRKCTEYYHWHKDSLPSEAQDMIAEQLARITEQLAQLMARFSAH
jgi:hypothetical protein